LYNDDILVVNNWLGAGKWNLPGGGLYKREDPKEGLIRETYEETGVKLSPSRVTLLATEWYRIHGFKYKCHYFTAQVKYRPSLRHQPYEIVETAWFKRTDVTTERHGPDVIRALELLDSHKRL
jgi:8-oxo-dGTP pyrophosphatase MutT (NUDIX family)